MGVQHSVRLVSFPDPPSGGREKEGLGKNPGWKCPEGRNSATGDDYVSHTQPLTKEVTVAAL